MNYGRIITKDRLKFYEVADNVWAAISPNRGLSWANAGYINRGKGLIYDTFFDLPHAQELRNFTIEQGGRAPLYNVNSHGNPDHNWGNQIFDDSILIMHEKAVAEGLADDPLMWEKLVTTGGDGGPGHTWLCQQFKGFDLHGIHWKDPDITIKENTTIHLNDTEVQLLSVAPAHSAGDVLVWLPKEKVVFCGDVVFGGAIAYSAEGMRLWNKALSFIVDELKPEVVVPGHGGICTSDFVKECGAYFDMVQEEFEKHFDPELSPLEIAKKCDVSPFLHHLQPERLVVNIRTLYNDRMGLSNKPDWNWNATEMVKLKAFHDEKYGARDWDPMSSWAE